MKKIIQPINLDNICFEKTIKIDQGVKYFTDIKELNPIPSKRIVHKTITGIGATHSEIIAARSSIIVLPHISVVVSKHEHYKITPYSDRIINTLAVYGEISVFNVMEYLDNLEADEDAKILTTPQGLFKVINAFYQIWPEEQIKDYFFLLIDECQKLIQNAMYRSDMLKLMDEFFSFEHSAMISATPIIPNDPRFAENGFSNIKIVPDYDYKQDIELIHSNSLINGLQNYFKANEAEHYFIFFDSIEGINGIIKTFNLESSAKLYCSHESDTRLKRQGISYSTWVLDNHFPQYSFFTSSFFNGLDIVVPYKPNIVLLSDIGFSAHSILDPYTDVLQIIGRVRRGDQESLPYNKVSHVLNSSHFSHPISQEEAIINIHQSETVYNSIATLKNSVVDNALHPLFDQALQTVKPYYNLLCDGTFSYFLADNYLDNERVKSYYKNISSLLNAYVKTDLFRTTLKRDYIDKDELIYLKGNSTKNSPEQIKMIAGLLSVLEDYKGLDLYFEQRVKINQYSPLAFDSFDKLGYEVMAQLGFKRRSLQKKLLQLAIEEGRNFYPVIDLVYITFKLNKYYPVEIVKQKLQIIFDKFKIGAIAKATDVERYFAFEQPWKTINGKHTRVYIFSAQKFNIVNVN